MRKTILALLVSLFIFPTVWAEEDLPPLPKGPLLLTSATPDMQSAEYWIKRITDAEKPIKTAEQLKHFNEEIHSMISECVDVFKLDKVRPGKQISSILQFEFDTLKNRKLFGIDDKYIQKEYFDTEIKPLMQIDQVPAKIKMKWGVATKATSVRALPVDMEMLEEKGDVEFDQLQYTQIKLWTPVGIFHKSSDGKWFYVQTPYVRGWVKAKDIALFQSREDIKKYLRPGRFFVVTGESIRVFRDKALQEMIYRPSMGTLIPSVVSAEVAEKKTGNTSSASVSGPYAVWMPFRKDDGSEGLMKCYVSRKSDVSKGYPVYSQANLLRQAFKLLGMRYGWGGMYNGRDCSGFVHDVFLSVGVDLPRDSKQQALVGTSLGYFKPFQDDKERTKALKSARPGMT